MKRGKTEAGTMERGVEICILINTKLTNYTAGYDCLWQDVSMYCQISCLWMNRV